MAFIKMINCNFEWLKGLDNFEKKTFRKNYTIRFFFPKYVKFSKWTAKAHVVLISIAFFSLNKRYNVKILHLFANFFLRKWVQRTFVIISLQLYRSLYFFFIKMSKNNVKLKNLIKFCIWVGSKRAYTDLKTKLQKLT